MSWLMLPFGLKPRVNDDGPRYGDIYERGVASGVDLALLYLVLNDLFHLITEKVYTYIDRDFLNQVDKPEDSIHSLALLWQAHVPQLLALNTAIQVSIIAVIYVTIQCVWGTTPGKWLLGLGIVRAKTFEKPERWRYALRFAGYILAIVPLMMGIFWVSFNRKRRGWHDYLADTVVIHTRPRGWLWEQAKRLFRALREKMAADAKTPTP